MSALLFLPEQVPWRFDNDKAYPPASAGAFSKSH